VKGTTRILILALCVGLSAFGSYAIRQHAPKTILMCDFGEIYYGARCALQHRDPYDPAQASNLLMRSLAAEGEKLPADPGRAAMARTLLAVEINLPTTLFLLLPLALLPWAIAQNLWMALIAGLLACAAFLVGDLGADIAPDLWLLLAGFLLANCEGLLLDGNAAGIAVSLCIIAAWCFLKQRCALAGAVLLAISLLIKPHDSGLVWLYFLLAGGALRKRALQTLAITAILAICAAMWIAPSSPHWPQELRNNLTAVSVHGGTSDPALSGSTTSGAGWIIDLQAALSILWNNPHFYNLTAYLIIGALILVWALITLARRPSPQQTLLGLAAISTLSLLPVYHRSNDAKLLLLAIPACAMLWTGKGAKRWLALALTSASIFFTADMPIAISGTLTRNLAISTSTLAGKLTAIFLLRPAPLLLLATGCFYLWVYFRYAPPADLPARNDAAANTLSTEAAI
jgi:hypothetical protein